MVACVERCARSSLVVLVALGSIAASALSGCSQPSAECEGRGDASTGLMAGTAGSPPKQRAYAAVSCDSQEIGSRISALRLAEADAKALQDGLHDLTTRALDEVTAGDIKSSRLPLSAAHEQMFATAAAAERAAGLTPLRAWAANPWAPLDPLESSVETSTGTLSASVMRGERRALALNLRSVSADARRVRIEVAIPGVDSGDLQIFRVNWTGNDKSNWAAAELEPLGDARNERETTLLAGVTQQLWIQAKPGAESQPGRFAGSVTLTADDGAATEIHIPLELEVFRVQFPQRPALHFGGWDYIDGLDYGYAVTQTNTADLLQHLQARYVDTPWAHQDVMHWHNIAADGTFVGTPDVTALERWISQWPDARRFRVYLNVRDEIAGIPANDDRFAPAVRAWAAAWAQAIRQLGRSEADFDLLLVDEPNTPEQARTTAAWARPIRESGASFKIWTDPFWSRPSQVPQDLIDAADTIALNLSLAEAAGSAYWQWARQMAARGKTIELYACDGPVRRLDPYAYYRLTAWRAFFADASAVSFWAFSDTGGSASDNEFAADDYSYSPLFIGTSIVRSGKHMEAAVQGVQDAQYLRMLAEVEAAHPSESVRAQARELLKQADEFLRKAPRSSNSQWRMQGDTSQIDRQTRRIGEFLDSAL